MRSPLKSIIVILAAVFLGCAFFSQHAEATLITGSIGFSGQIQYDTGDLNTADAIIRWGNTKVQSADGSFGGIAQLTAANFSAPWNFDPSTPRAGLWSVGGFTFDLLTSTIVNQGGGLLTLTGTGIVTGNAFESTAGTWSFTSQGTSNGRFIFSAGNTAVPDGGSALALLGIGVVGVEALRRKIAAG